MLLDIDGEQARELTESSIQIKVQLDLAQPLQRGLSIKTHDSEEVWLTLNMKTTRVLL